MTSFEKFDETELPPIEMFLQWFVGDAHYRVGIPARKRCVECLRHDNHETVPWLVFGNGRPYIIGRYDGILQSLYEGLRPRPEALCFSSRFQLGRSFFIKQRQTWSFSLTRKCIYLSSRRFGVGWPSSAKGTRSQTIHTFLRNIMTPRKNTRMLSTPTLTTCMA